MKKLFNLIALAVTCLTAMSASAHQPNISSATLIQQENGEWTLQLNASMTAFQYIVKDVFGEDSYSSPEEFNEMVMTHFRDNMSLYINENKMTLGEGFVKLGHASALVFELSEVPTELNEVKVRNEGFKNIPHSQCVFSIYRQGMDQDRFILSDENDYQVKLFLKDDQLLLANSPFADYSMILISGAMVFGLSLVFLFTRKLRLFQTHPSTDMLSTEL